MGGSPPHATAPGAIAGLYAITDASLGARLLPAVAAALAGGCRWLQYRDKSTDADRRQREAQRLLALCREHGARLLINDDIELALAVGADGAHLGQGDTPLGAARARLGQDAVIGITCHGRLDLARAAVAGGADYVAFGRFFPSTTKPEAPPAPLTLLHQAKAALPVPLVAIGGVTLDNARQLRAAGADAVAVVGDLFGADDIQARAEAYQALFASPLTDRPAR